VVCPEKYLKVASMIKTVLSFILICCSVSFAEHPAKYVDPFIGTGGHGHTFPGATVPFGMVQLSPDTRVEGWDACGGYHYSDSTILGFSHMHLSGTGIADYGDVLLMPTVGAMRIVAGDIKIPGSGYRSRFSHEHEKASPGYYRVQLEDYNVNAELTTSQRIGFHRYTFPTSDNANIIIDLQHGLGPDKVIASDIQIVNDKEVAGFRRSEGWAKDQYVYFVAQFSKPFSSFGTAVNDTLHPNEHSSSGTNIKGYVRFSTSKNEKILVKVGISSVSIEGARNNILSEIPGWNFDQVKSHAEKLWNDELGKIEVNGGTPGQYTTFYTALYHALLAPNTYSDADGRYRGMEGKIHQATGFTMHSVFSLWDTFRAEHPLLTMIDQQRTEDIIKSFLARYDESGILPVWELSSNETWCMIGYHAVPVIVDAYIKGIKGFDAAKAFNAMRHSAELNHFGLKEYREQGYMPGDKEGESVSKTLEYAYDDWCIAQMAKALKRTNDYHRYSQRAQYYKNIYDASTGFMRPKENGGWVEPFDPASVTVHYTEANPWQYSFFAPQDINGLMNIMGGKKSFIKKLDALFGAAPQFTGRDQADITGMIGQYAQGNEPSHHVAYLYDYAGVPWKTQATVRRIMDSLYTALPDGLCGNDDCGQMSAWYVMSAMGLYQVTPGDPIYSLGSPLFQKITLHLENGKQFAIKAMNNSLENKYIQSAMLNGKKYTKCFIAHQSMMNGGGMNIIMGPNPNTQWGSATKDGPPAMPMKAITSVPYIVSKGKTFVDSVTVVLACDTKGAEIYYTVNGDRPTKNSTKYISPLLLTEANTINAFAVAPGMIASTILISELVKSHPVGILTLKTRYDDQYTGGGDGALVDGLRGGTNFRLGPWQGYHQRNLDAIIDLGMNKTIHSVSLGCLQDNNSWIFFPTEASFSFSDDGITYHDSLTVVNELSPKEMDVMIKDFGRNNLNIRARYIRVLGKNIGICPSWHKGAGEKAWLFVDEILVDAK
jgi:predicted alpha-1,2-mannosidase